MTPTKATILTVEDDESIQEVIRAYLLANDYEVYSATTGPDGWALFQKIQPDVVILDLNLPGMDGMTVAAKIRQVSDAYIMMLTARDDEVDRIAGLRLGADDYLTKPFSAREMVVRVETLLRRSRETKRAAPPTAEHIVESPHVRVDLNSYDVIAGGQKLELTATEFDLLVVLMRHHNQVLSREQILNLVWGDSFYRTDRVVDVYVGQVRRKLEAATDRSLIITIRGVGYKFLDEPA